MTNPVFSSRAAMMLAMLGMAVGTGNIWRFPRIAASNGGGSFLVAWVVFLLLWSVPLILVEFAAGKETRSGPIGAFAKLAGKKYSWMGAWVAFVATAIMFYYTVVMGWTLRYLFGAVTGTVPTAACEPGAAGCVGPQEFWDGFIGSPWPILTHALAIGLAVFVVLRGVRGIERAARFLIPSLLLLVVVLAIRAVTLPGASAGLAFLFTPDWGKLGDPTIWLEALTQNAWDTGAGWGLITAYAIYMKKREDTTLNAFMLGFGNNSVSLLAGIMVLCTVFAILPGAADQIVGAGNEGLTFIWVPQLFGLMPGGSVFMVLFFLALVFAAWSSLIAMIELATRVLTDAGIDRRKAVLTIGGLGFALGLPSAIWIEVFRNQDWVWGVGLMLSGLFFSIMVMRHGVDRFRTRFVNSEGSDLVIGKWWNVVIRLVAVQAVVIIVWWLWEAVDLNDLAATFTPISEFNVGTVLVQWAIAIAVFLGLNRWLATKAAGLPATPDDA
ncbi:sodium-dependent transporter [Candidatus Palauibacter sp.]|uniref:sodium-dependent transporter n=1 Tax=Candidatus Palauibacter sp. TaxID=3101350 RepID=UPI003B5CC376